MTARSPHVSTPAGPSGGGSAGFTLLEVLLVIVVIGIVSAIVIPSIASSTDPHEATEAARKVHSVLVEARARAVAEQRNTRFELGSDGSYEIQFDDGGTWTPYGAPRSLGSGITGTIGGSGTGTIVFQPHGRADDPTEIVIQSSASERTIRVLASGLVRWEGRRQ